MHKPLTEKDIEEWINCEDCKKFLLKFVRKYLGIEDT